MEEHLNHDIRSSDIQVKIEEAKFRQETLGAYYSGLYQEVSGNICSICLEIVNTEWKHPDCQSHIFCQNCVRSYLRIKINDSQVLKISCPGEACSHLFTESMIESLTAPELFEKYTKFK